MGEDTMESVETAADQKPNAVEVIKEEVKARVTSLFDQIRSGEEGEIQKAVIELRLLSKWEIGNRIVIGETGGIPLVISLLSSPVSKIQESAVTTLHNLSLFPANRTTIMETEGGLESIADVLRSGATWESKENAAALLTSLLTVDTYREAIGSNVDLLVAMRDLLRNGRVQGKKDALGALFYLAMVPQNISRFAASGIISSLRLLLMAGQSNSSLLEEVLSVLAQVAKSSRGTDSLRDPQTISLIVESLQNGSRQAKEHSASLLLVMCQTGGESVSKEVRRYKLAISEVLSALLTEGSPRAKSKANDLMQVVKR